MAKVCTYSAKIMLLSRDTHVPFKHLFFTSLFFGFMACKDNSSTIESNQPQESKFAKSGIETIPDRMITTSNAQRPRVTPEEKKDIDGQGDEEISERDRKPSKTKNSRPASGVETDPETDALAIPVPPKANTNLSKNRPAAASPDWSDILLKAGIGAVAGTAAGSLLDSAISDPSTTGGSNTAAILGGLSGAVIGGIMANDTQSSSSGSSNALNSP